MTCVMRDGHSAKHMSTTWAVLQTTQERSPNTSKMFPGVMIDNIKKNSPNISRWNLLCRRGFTVSDLSYLCFTYVECRISQGYCWLIHYIVSSCDWQFRFCVTKGLSSFTYLISIYSPTCTLCLKAFSFPGWSSSQDQCISILYWIRLDYFCQNRLKCKPLLHN
jgi:hypothetical protein